MPEQIEYLTLPSDVIEKLHVIHRCYPGLDFETIIARLAKQKGWHQVPHEPELVTVLVRASKIRQFPYPVE
jgi:hypothetical protein